jgi:hypothetical protein
MMSLIILVVGIPSTARAGQQGWTVDLARYGFREWRENSGQWNSSELRLAAGKKLVAVGLSNPSSKTQTDKRGDHTDANWEISLLLFDPATGKLNSRSGPWTGDRFFELFCTSEGNLLLLLRHYIGAIGEIGETLFLLSPTGNELKRLYLSPSIRHSKPDWNHILVSSSGRIMLEEQVLEDGTHYKLLGTNTFEMQSQWSAEAGSIYLSVVGLSDQELLGVGASRDPKKTSAGLEDRELYVRSFDGHWSPFLASLDVSHHGIGLGLNSNQLAFLSDHTIVGITTKQESRKAAILALRTDGTTIFSPKIPELEANTSLSGPVYVTQDGRYFAAGFTHRPWLSHLMLDVWQMDMTFQNDESVLLIWTASGPVPVAQVNLGNAADARALSIIPDDPLSVALLSRNTLKFIRVLPM